METERGYEKDKKDNNRKIRVKVYFNLKSFQAVAQDAEKAGKRRGGLLLFTQRSHGLAGETVSNTDGISKFLKYCWEYWRENEHVRVQQVAEILRKEKELQEEKKRLGLA